MGKVRPKLRPEKYTDRQSNRPPNAVRKYARRNMYDGAHSSGDDKDELGGGGGYMGWKGEELDQSRHVDNPTPNTEQAGKIPDKKAYPHPNDGVE